MISTCAKGQKENKVSPLFSQTKTDKNLKCHIPFASVIESLFTKLIKWNFVLVAMETGPLPAASFFFFTSQMKVENFQKLPRVI